MGSQFVDFNGDGHLDYLTATFDGSPHLALGSAEGFGEPARLKDAQGRRIAINYIWDYEKKTHRTVEVPNKADGETPRKQRCISALAFDWDADGDYDLLLGSYEDGVLYRQMNEGSKTEPRFTGVNIPVMAGDKQFQVPQTPGSAYAVKMTTPRLVDWDQDGDMDIIAGSFGSRFSGAPGSISLFVNEGQKGSPKFRAPQSILVPPQKLTGPDAAQSGLYPEVVDYDGDGDLDLIVGGYVSWTPKARKLSKAEQATVKALRRKLSKVNQERAVHYQKLNKLTTEAMGDLDAKSVEARKIRAKVYSDHREDTTRLTSRQAAIKAEIDKLVPSKQSKSFVWLYERLPAESGG